MPGDPVVVERRESAALLTLNRPEKHNALSLELLTRLQAIVRELGDDASIRVLIVRGNDRCFSTGMDLDDLSGVSGVADTQRALAVARDANASIERCPKPIIAAIAGWCLTGGLELALACDVRVAAENARFGITSARIGTVAAAGGEVDAALEMARLWARRAPLGLWYAKQAVNVGLTMPLEAALAFEIGLTTQ